MVGAYTGEHQAHDDITTYVFSKFNATSASLMEKSKSLTGDDSEFGSAVASLATFDLAGWMSSQGAGAPQALENQDEIGDMERYLAWQAKRKGVSDDADDMFFLNASAEQLERRIRKFHATYRRRSQEIWNKLKASLRYQSIVRDSGVQGAGQSDPQSADIAQLKVYLMSVLRGDYGTDTRPFTPPWADEETGERLRTNHPPDPAVHELERVRLA